MCVPIPLIVAARIPITQKMILVALFCSGVFVMICAALRAYYSITDINTLETALGWASRECFVSVFIVCAPGIKPLFARFRWFGTNVSSNEYSNTKSRGKVFSSKNSHNFNTLVSAHERELYEMTPSVGWRKYKSKDSSDESQEHIISSSADAKQDENMDMGIRVTTDVHLALENTQTGASGRSRY